MKGDGGGQIFLHDKTSFLSSHSDLEKSPLYDSECLGNLPALFSDSHIYLATFLWEKGTGLTSIQIQCQAHFNTFFGSDRSPRRGDLVCACVRACVCPCVCDIIQNNSENEF